MARCDDGSSNVLAQGRVEKVSQNRIENPDHPVDSRVPSI